MDKETAKQEVERIVNQFLAIPKSELDEMPEEQIKFRFIEPLFEALGLEREDIEKEKRVLKGRADYILKIGNQDNLVVEAKKTSVGLNEEEGRQAISYAYHKNIKFAVLTNFARIRVYHALSNIKIYDGSTLLGIVPALTNSDTFRLGLKWSSINITPLTVPNNTHKIITIKSNINTSASGSVRLGVVGLGDFKPWPLKTNWPSSYGVFGPYMTIATATTTPSSPADPTTSQGSSSSSSPSDPTTSSQSLNQSAQTANTLESMRQILNQMLESLKNKQKEDFI